jgi:hypothetical protein
VAELGVAFLSEKPTGIKISVPNTSPRDFNLVSLLSVQVSHLAPHTKEKEIAVSA